MFAENICSRIFVKERVTRLFLLSRWPVWPDGYIISSEIEHEKPWKITQLFQCFAKHGLKFYKIPKESLENSQRLTLFKSGEIPTNLVALALTQIRFCEMVLLSIFQINAFTFCNFQNVAPLSLRSFIPLWSDWCIILLILIIIITIDRWD